MHNVYPCVFLNKNDHISLAGPAGSKHEKGNCYNAGENLVHISYIAAALEALKFLLYCSLYHFVNVNT